MKKQSTLLATLLLAACGNVRPPTVEASSANEIWILNETKRFAEKLHKPKIEGRMVNFYRVIPAGVGGCPKDAPEGCKTAGWFDDPIVYYWAGFIDRETNTLSDLTNLAAHEVCHSVSREHDQLHWNCILALGADPTYAPHD